jgi:hypothetical protein
LDQDPVSTCPSPSKVQHKSPGAAAAHLNWLRREQGANADLNIYPCAGHWHVGHSQRKLVRRIRQALRRK